MGSGLCKTDKVSDELSEDFKKRHKEIEEEIAQEKLDDKKRIKILLLGASDSGKSTIVKQMRILHKNGFKESELINFCYMIYSNLIVSYHYVASGIHQLSILVPENEEDLVYRFKVEHFTMYDMKDEEQIEMLKEMKDYQSVKELMSRRSEVYLPDNTIYFFDQLDRILTPGYKPNVMDILYTRSATSGVHEISFGFKEFTIRLIDVGGQKTERRKWIHCFDNVMSVLFVVALSCYDQFMLEDPKKNCMVDSEELFSTMFQNNYLLKCSFILFLNKKDLFEDKLKFVDLKQFYPKYKGENDYESASNYIKGRFMKKNDTRRTIYSHFTNAVDTKNIEFVFKDTCDIIVQKNFSRTGVA